MIQMAVHALILTMFNGIELLYFCVLQREWIHEILDIKYIFISCNITHLVMQLVMTWSIHLWQLLQCQNIIRIWFIA